MFSPAASHRICASGPVLGELLLTTVRDTIDKGETGFRVFKRMMELFWSWTKDGKLEFYMFGENPGALFKIEQELYQVDHMLAPTDLAILACFLSDDEAELLFTTDRALVVNIPIGEYLSENWKGKAITSL